MRAYGPVFAVFNKSRPPESSATARVSGSSVMSKVYNQNSK